MERVAEDDHPLAPAAPLSISTNHGHQQQQQQQQLHHRSYRTPSASLIHSAVRSVLDDATPNSTIISDDQSETSAARLPGDSSVSPRFWTNSQQQQQQEVSSPTLESLQMERIPPIPDKQDRKRFIVSTGSSC